MANELSITAALTYVNAAFSIPTRTFAPGAINRDVAGSALVENVQIVGTSAEALIIGDVVTPGYMICKNLDATNYVTIRNGSTGADLVKLKAGDIAVFRLATATPFAIANTASCKLLYLVVED